MNCAGNVCNKKKKKAFAAGVTTEEGKIKQRWRSKGHAQSSTGWGTGRQRFRPGHSQHLPPPSSADGSRWREEDEGKSLMRGDAETGSRSERKKKETKMVNEVTDSMRR